MIGSVNLGWKGRQMTGYNDLSGPNLLYKYNADGIRIKKTRMNGDEYAVHDYTLNGTQIITESVNSTLDGVYLLVYLYDENGAPIGMRYRTPSMAKNVFQNYFFEKNLQGDIIGIWNQSGTKIVTYTYDAWGNVTVSGTSASTIGKWNPFRYRGYYYDVENGLYYLQSRYYNPAWGRFISPDSTDTLLASETSLTDKNLFAYCDNNPIMRADNGGDFWHILIGAAVGALISGVVKVVSNAIEGNSLTDGLATAMLSGAASGALASTGIGIVGMVAGNAAISMAENVANQVIENKGFNNFDIGDTLIDGAIGGIAGALGGAGKGTKHLTNLGKQTVKRTFNATTNRGLKAGLKEAGKAFAYYGKNSAKYYKAFIRGIPSDVIFSIGTTIVSSSYMKYQYRRIFGS